MAQPRAADAAEALAPVTARAGCTMGVHAERAWAPHQALAWEGLLEVARLLRRDAETTLEAGHGLGISMLGVLGRLLRAPNRTLRQTDLADAMGLSLSRISRVIDTLERRELVVRRRCPSDARAVNVTVTTVGGTLAQDAQAGVFAAVEAAFTNRLTDAEVRALAGIVTKLLTG